MRLVALGIAFLAMGFGVCQAQPYPTDVVTAGRQMVAGDATGRRTLEALAHEGRADAAELLGELIARAEPKAACEYFEQAAKTLPTATHNLAQCWEKGTGRPVDLAKAAKLYESAAQAGMVQAKCALGNMLIAGRGVAKDVARGVSLCTEAANAGNIQAMADVGDIYILGQGVPRDAAKARRYYEPAAAKGQANAAFTLGQIYWNGDGVAKDNALAAKWWKVAFDGGRQDAARLLGDEAFVRSTQSNDRVDRLAAQQAVDWYQQAERLPPERDLKPTLAERLKHARDLLALAK